MGVFFKRFFATILGLLTAVLLFLGGVVAVLSVFVASMGDTIEVERGSVLVVDLSQDIVDAPRGFRGVGTAVSSLFSGYDKRASLTLFDVVRALEYAAGDSDIVGVSLIANGASPISLANAEELREALAYFKSSSAKPVYAFGESFSQVEYYIASVADEVYVAPLGAVEWQGMAVNMMFYKPLMDKLGVTAEVFRPASCNYKSAVEPFTRSSMSEQSREQSLQIVKGFWGGVIRQVAASRGLSVAELERIAANRIIVEAKESKALKMTDGVGYFDEYEAKVGDVNISLGDYSTLLKSQEQGSGAASKNRIAIIYVDGQIVDGESDFSNKSVGSKTLVGQLRRAKDDDSVKAVVLRVNSPGGSALAADIIWREVGLLRAEKPVVVSMGAYAASGGYYVSVPADVIVAGEFTLTGSIGVYGLMLNAQEAMRGKLHIYEDGVVSSPSADFGRVSRPVTALERAAVMRGVDNVYDTFVDCVASGRKVTPAVVKALAGGRVWSGADAVGCNLADVNGGLRSALTIAIKRSGIDSQEYSIVEVSEDSDPFSVILATLYSAVGGGFGAVVYDDLSLFRSTDSHLYMHSPLRLSM